jgi:hypothetical protein
MGVRLAGAGDHVYTAAYDKTEKRGALYRWGPVENGTAELLWEFDQWPMGLAVEPGQGVAERVWLLFSDGSAAAVSRGGEVEKHASPPSWPLAGAFAIQVLPGADGAPYIFMAHSDGLLQLCDAARRSACGQD